MTVSIKGTHFPPEIILTGVRWYVACPLSTRHLKELMLERGGHVGHATIIREVIKYGPPLDEAFHRRKRLVWESCRIDETPLRVKGQSSYLHCVINKTGQAIDFLLTKHRDERPPSAFSRT